MGTIRVMESSAATRAFLILHGFGYEGDPDHWHSRLARHLAAAGNDVSYPRLPTPEEPALAVWRQVLADELAAAAGERIVICHSLACLLWIHHAPAVGEPVDRLLLVAPPEDDEVPEPAAEFRTGRVDAGALRASSRTVPRVVRGERDPYSPSGMPLWARAARCELEEIPGAEHLNPDDGHGPWPELTRWCEDPTARLAP
jgi:predicted alpha/beta hydrolase family esterase